MSLNARIGTYRQRPVLFINDVPTTEFWCYGDPNAIRDFEACGLRICQFHVPFPSWWTGPGQYDFEPTAQKIREFLDLVPSVLLLPRVNFGYVGEEWWGRLHPDELAVGLDLTGRPVDYMQIRARPVDCWFSSASKVWTDDATQAMRAFVDFCETRFGEHILGYQIGGGISAEWFRWWNFVERTYEDYSAVALAAFRRYLRDKYVSDDRLRSAWHRPDVNLDTAELPSPQRQHETALGYLRDPQTERDVVDWLECLSVNNVTQILSLAEAAKSACKHRKIVGTFFGYLWPHWNTQCPAKAGHIGLERVLASPFVDYISSPYHYDNRHVGGFHHSQTVPQTIERAGKLHLDEIDTFTHLVIPEKTLDIPYRRASNARESCQLLRRDAATVLGTAGTGWWMDLYHHRWYADSDIQAEVRRLQAMGRQSLEWDCRTHAEVALVVDDRSYMWASPWSVLNQAFTSMPRQLEWSDLGFPIDTLMLREVPTARPYKLYVFLNCWYIHSDLRRQVAARVRTPGTTAIWFHACGCIDETSCDPSHAAELIGMQLAWMPEPAVPEVGLLEPAGDGIRVFGARLRPDQIAPLVTGPHHDWSQVATPRLKVTDADATVLGRYTDNGEPGLAVVERDGWRSVFCGAPLLPGVLLAKIAAQAGVHRYAPLGTQVFHRGPLVSAYRPRAGRVEMRAPMGLRLRPLVYDAGSDIWQPTGEPCDVCTGDLEAGETRFYWAE
ncbi:MAG TPA: hypothetical protein PL151_08705 [Phycisphaerae bacterium]|nr:hypothetical protein [Phycisphaerae bacterium]HOJ73232.1 hypothetical protein [Phycisphaerae bacterium]HOM51202.1 hypothetical protein [Phycisphaerae bacterium]HON65451.1 hypothetical protein [Phycisphaerae bacterium]HOQ85480.1 hypothetical protein [Phycisphaerae bacterium]